MYPYNGDQCSVFPIKLLAIIFNVINYKFGLVFTILYQVYYRKKKSIYQVIDNNIQSSYFFSLLLLSKTHNFNMVFTAWFDPLLLVLSIFSSRVPESLQMQLQLYLKFIQLNVSLFLLFQPVSSFCGHITLFPACFIFSCLLQCHQLSSTAAKEFSRDLYATTSKNYFQCFPRTRHPLKLCLQRRRCHSTRQRFLSSFCGSFV